MNIKFFKIYCDIVDSGNISRAANLNGITQSAVSQQLIKLEQQLGTTLISRGRASAVATAEGRVFYQSSQRICREYEQLLDNINSQQDTVRGTLRICTTISTGCYITNALANEFLQANPKVDLQIEYMKSNAITPAILSGELDLGIVDYPEKLNGIEIVPLAQEKMVAVCSPRHPLASRRSISVMNLQDERFVAFRSSTPIGQYVQKMLESRKVSVDVVRQFDNIETLKAAIEADAGLSILPWASISRSVTDGHLAWTAFHDGATWARPIGVARPKNKPPGKIETIFLEIINQKFKSQAH